MGRVISIANQKGGVGKTTTAINLSACLSEIGQKVLTIDIDPQGNTTSGLGVDKHAVENNVYALLLGESTIEECIIETKIENQSLISSDVNLAGAEIELIGIDEKEYILKKAISKIKDNYDFIIIDCPPSLNMLTVNALTASDTVLVPIQCEYYALEGLSQLIHTIELVQKRLNPDLDILGILLTMYDGRTNLSVQVRDEVESYFGDTVFKTVIPRSVKLSEAPGFGQPITLYAPKSKGGVAYKKLSWEVLKRVEK